MERGIRAKHNLRLLAVVIVWGSVLALIAREVPALELEKISPADEVLEEPAQPYFGLTLDKELLDSGPADILLASMLQNPPALLPRGEVAPLTPAPPAADRLASNLFGPGLLGRSLLSGNTPARGLQQDVISGAEARSRATTDAGSLLGKSPEALGINVQRRTPIISDPRVRGSRVGQLAASGSYWVPARIDLDSELSKFDSRIIGQMTVVKGPYSVLYGPGFDFINVDLLHTPRYEQGFEVHGSTAVDYKTNGQQWYGRQNFWGGDSTWGFRGGYGHSTGNDYTAGNGVQIPSSYNSRALDLAFGADLSPDSSVEFNGLRLDQTNVEFPGMAFDIDYLKTDGYELQYVLRNQSWCDRTEMDVWYNRTVFYGSAQRPGKRRQFPIFDFMHYVGYTDVDSASTGFRVASTWGQEDEPKWTAGIDFREIRQELNEIASGRIGFNVFTDANSPIPRSDSVNPGLFVERSVPLDEQLTAKAGARVDLARANVIDDPAKLAALGLQMPQSSLAEILGSDEYEQHFQDWALYFSLAYKVDDNWTWHLAGGHSERPPGLTELYAAQPFMFLLQNGANTVTGDPRLSPERLWQVDLGVSCKYERFRAGINGYHAWMLDYITFENLDVFYGPPIGAAEQVSIKYVNTDLATLVGTEMYGEYDLNEWLTPFATLQYVDGRDRTRNGAFATQQAFAGNPSVRVYGLPRGYYSGIAGTASEPLPGISPLESRLGLRLHQPVPAPRWAVELSARVVDEQDRVATSLLETPTPGFTVWDLRGSRQIGKHLLCTAGVENFTNKAYREHLDFRSPSGIAVYRPGTTFYFGAELMY